MHVHAHGHEHVHRSSRGLLPRNGPAAGMRGAALGQSTPTVPRETSRPLSSRRPFFTAASLSFVLNATTLHRGMTMSTTTAPVSFSPASKGYVKPEVLVTTDWVAEHLNDPK